MIDRTKSEQLFGALTLVVAIVGIIWCVSLALAPDHRVEEWRLLALQSHDAARRAEMTMAQLDDELRKMGIRIEPSSSR